ncbi:hypothetical protein SASPL_111821 [Salvia splendens]|uniref:RING-type E3 ubiquitin transferase n=1 Tax=Salvia splendens TaxID=180675 RepID=A0A8X8Y729_SALSN|nr:RING-H2 finger protein ATL70-like [Salvia splendens]KAG6427575.1 hypothetical protein SASPL_111821 [Salvia splendens]
MNSTTDSGGFLGSESIGGFGYGIGVSVGILLLITTITLASYYCTRNTNTHTSLPRAQRHDPVAMPGEGGLDEATLTAYPKLLYSKVKQHKDSSTAACCSICLANYKPTDMLRALPECGHFFHLRCVDPWLRLHPTCPLCRTSPLPTPLAEVVPLATRPGG